MSGTIAEREQFMPYLTMCGERQPLVRNAGRAMLRYSRSAGQADGYQPSRQHAEKSLFVWPPDPTARLVPPFYRPGPLHPCCGPRAAQEMIATECHPGSQLAAFAARPQEAVFEAATGIATCAKDRANQIRPQSLYEIVIFGIEPRVL